MQEGPYFDELAVGQEFGGAPGITLTSGLAAAHQAITGDRLVLATDHDLCRRVTGGDPLASPSLVWDVAIGQSTVVTQHVKANLFYRGLAFRRAPRLGDTLRTSTQVVALRQNQPRQGRAPTGLAVLRITTVDQQRRPVLDFWRCAMLPLRDEDRQTGHADDLASVGQAIGDAAALVSGWRLAEFAERAAGPRLAELRAGQSWTVPGGDVVSGAPELARLTLNMAMAHHDAQAAGGQRLVYGGHTIGLALAQAARSLPSLVTVTAWHGCDHLGPVHEGDTLRSTITVEQVDPLPACGGLVHLRSRVRAEAPSGGDQQPRHVLDWRYVAVVALREGQSLCGPHHAGAAPGVLGRVLVVRAGEHAGELGCGEPPGVQRDDQEHQVSRVEIAVQDARVLGGRVGLRLMLMVRGPARLVRHRPAGQALPQQEADELPSRTAPACRRSTCRGAPC